MVQLFQAATFCKKIFIVFTTLYLISCSSNGRNSDDDAITNDAIVNNVQPGEVSGNVEGEWYYIAIFKDGAQQELNNRESYLSLKEDGTYLNRFGVLNGSGSQEGTYKVSGKTLTLNRSDGYKVSYTMTFGNEGKGSHGLSGNSLKLSNSDGGFLMER